MFMHTSRATGNRGGGGGGDDDVSLRSNEFDLGPPPPVPPKRTGAKGAEAELPNMRSLSVAKQPAGAVRRASPNFVRATQSSLVLDDSSGRTAPPLPLVVRSASGVPGACRVCVPTVTGTLPRSRRHRGFRRRTALCSCPS